MKIIQFSDLHITPPDGLLFGSDPLDRLRSCVQHVNRHHADADLCVLTGDLTHAGHPRAYERLREGLQDLIPPVRLMMGNHDSRSAFHSVFPQATTDLPGFVQRAETLGDWRLIYLDTLEDGYTNGYLCTRRLQWLQQELAAHRGPVMLFSHHPLPALQYPSMDWLRMSNASDLLPLLKAHPAPVHLFSGHVHRCTSGVWNGLHFVTVNGTNHQHELDLEREGAATSTFEPASYALILPNADGLTVHFQPFGYEELRFPYTGDLSALKCV
ncbi:phosphodiesterase [Alcaligenes nematophilus]|uniref:phosphodiesterase n=1 Tax=Alcaligenes nematophilus TaxID=2994643 RepID=UPI00384D5438